MNASPIHHRRDALAWLVFVAQYRANNLPLVRVANGHQCIQELVRKTHDRWRGERINGGGGRGRVVE